jgi:hypothetical protein
LGIINKMVIGRITVPLCQTAPPLNLGEADFIQ